CVVTDEGDLAEHESHVHGVDELPCEVYGREQEGYADAEQDQVDGYPYQQEARLPFDEAALADHAFQVGIAALHGFTCRGECCGGVQCHPSMGERMAGDSTHSLGVPVIISGL